MAAVIDSTDEVVACSVRTPPWKPVITRGSAAALECLVIDLAHTYGVLPAVLGLEPEVARFAELWSAHTGAPVRPGARQRVFEARSVTQPSRPPSGRLRVAQPDDFPLIHSWTRAFTEDVGLADHHDPAEATRSRITEGRIFVWEDRETVSMAALAGRAGRGARVNLVYTPPEHRQKGYASVCVATLTQRLLDEDLDYCLLFTDLANPTSNHIYQSIGYERVCDMSDYLFE